ncbi:Uncharacterised protein [Plesiomonas shigelloides]|nr:Uncharacterised protein [Plesiomonas shigelloides]
MPAFFFVCNPSLITDFLSCVRALYSQAQSIFVSQRLALSDTANVYGGQTNKTLA